MSLDVQLWQCMYLHGFFFLFFWQWPLGLSLHEEDNHRTAFISSSKYIISSGVSVVHLCTLILSINKSFLKSHLRTATHFLYLVLQRFSMSITRTTIRGSSLEATLQDPLTLTKAWMYSFVPICPAVVCWSLFSFCITRKTFMALECTQNNSFCCSDMSWLHFTMTKKNLLFSCIFP